MQKRSVFKQMTNLRKLDSPRVERRNSLRFPIGICIYPKSLKSRFVVLLDELVVRKNDLEEEKSHYSEDKNTVWKRSDSYDSQLEFLCALCGKKVSDEIRFSFL